MTEFIPEEKQTGRPIYFVLKDKVPVPETDPEKWVAAFMGNRQVAFHEEGGVQISTVFLGINHRRGEGPPLLFETLVFGGPRDGEIERYSTWDEAEAGHARMVERVRKGE